MIWKYWIALYTQTHCTSRGLRSTTIAAYQKTLEQFREYVRLQQDDLPPSQVSARMVDDDDTVLAEYQYLGLGAVVQQDSPQADLRSTLVSLTGTNDPDTGDIYSGLDRFGRVTDVRWRDVSASSDLSRVQYGYDRASNRTWRRIRPTPAIITTGPTATTASSD